MMSKKNKDPVVKVCWWKLIVAGGMFALAIIIVIIMFSV